MNSLAPTFCFSPLGMALVFIWCDLTSGWRTLAWPHVIYLKCASLRSQGHERGEHEALNLVGVALENKVTMIIALLRSF